MLQCYLSTYDKEVFYTLELYFVAVDLAYKRMAQYDVRLIHFIYMYFFNFNFCAKSCQVPTLLLIKENRYFSFPKIPKVIIVYKLFYQ